MARWLLALLLVLPATVLGVACGDSDSETGDKGGGGPGDAGQGGAAGAGATGGSTSNGGASGTAGSATRGGTAGDAGAPGTGGTGDSGAPGTGGAAGTTGGAGPLGGEGGVPVSGGAGGEGPDPCPDTAPTNGADCDTPRTLCQYERTRCACRGDGPTWTCQETTCPETRPENATSCSLDDTRVCRYEGATCLCSPAATSTTPVGEWNCARCPAVPPMNDARCPTIGAECPYPDDVTCTCTRAGWTCVR